MDLAAAVAGQILAPGGGARQQSPRHREEHPVHKAFPPCPESVLGITSSQRPRSARDRWTVTSSKRSIRTSVGSLIRPNVVGFEFFLNEGECRAEGMIMKKLTMPRSAIVDSGDDGQGQIMNR